MARTSRRTVEVQDTELGSIQAVPVKASEKIYAGTWVAIETATGLLVNVIEANRANYTKKYLAIDSLDNSSGSAGVINADGTGERTVRVYAEDVIVIDTFSDTLAQTDVGAAVYVKDNEKLTKTSTGAGGIMGVITKIQGTGKAAVRIKNA
jgi:hypothetical protein